MNAADSRRILHRYRRLILLGKAALSIDVARRLVGPDCAYHLYFRHDRARKLETEAASSRPRPRGGRKPRRRS